MEGSEVLLQIKAEDLVVVDLDQMEGLLQPLRDLDRLNLNLKISPLVNPSLRVNPLDNLQPQLNHLDNLNLRVNPLVRLQLNLLPLDSHSQLRIISHLDLLRPHRRPQQQRLDHRPLLLLDLDKAMPILLLLPHLVTLPILRLQLLDSLVALDRDRIRPVVVLLLEQALDNSNHKAVRITTLRLEEEEALDPATITKLVEALEEQPLPLDLLPPLLLALEHPTIHLLP